jgi:hypothetical protein
MVYSPRTGAPATLSQLAVTQSVEVKSKRYRSENGEDDQVWVVFDRDEHDYVDASIDKCKAAQVGVAFSDPCFEVWLILHVEDYDRDEHRYHTQGKCQEVCEGYERNGRKMAKSEKLVLSVETAEARAEALRQRRQADGGNAPWTSVDPLTRAMRDLT